MYNNSIFSKTTIVKHCMAAIFKIWQLHILNIFQTEHICVSTIQQWWNCNQIYTYVYTHIYICTCVYVKIYIWISRELWVPPPGAGRTKIWWRDNSESHNTCAIQRRRICIFGNGCVWLTHMNVSTLHHACWTVNEIVACVITYWKYIHPTINTVCIARRRECWCVLWSKFMEHDS